MNATETIYCLSPFCDGHQVAAAELTLETRPFQRIPFPRRHLHIYCPCGGQWHGRRAAVRALHHMQARDCGPMISETAFRFLGFTPRWTWTTQPAPPVPPPEEP